MNKGIDEKNIISGSGENSKISERNSYPVTSDESESENKTKETGLEDVLNRVIIEDDSYNNSYSEKTEIETPDKAEENKEKVEEDNKENSIRIEENKENKEKIEEENKENSLRIENEDNFENKNFYFEETNLSDNLNNTEIKVEMSENQLSSKMAMFKEKALQYATARDEEKNRIINEIPASEHKAFLQTVLGLETLDANFRKKLADELLRLEFSFLNSNF